MFMIFLPSSFKLYYTVYHYCTNKTTEETMRSINKQKQNKNSKQTKNKNGLFFSFHVRVPTPVEKII